MRGHEGALRGPIPPINSKPQAAVPSRACVALPPTTTAAAALWRPRSLLAAVRPTAPPLPSLIAGVRALHTRGCRLAGSLRGAPRGGLVGCSHHGRHHHRGWAGWAWCVSRHRPTAADGDQSRRFVSSSWLPLPPPLPPPPRLPLCFPVPPTLSARAVTCGRRGHRGRPTPPIPQLRHAVVGVHEAPRPTPPLSSPSLPLLRPPWTVRRRPGGCRMA